MAEWKSGSSLCNSIQDFMEGLRKTFNPVSTERERARELSVLKRERESVCDYAIRFRTLAVQSGWNSMALYDFFLKGLAASIQERLLPLEVPPDLDSLIALTIRTDNRLREFRALQGAVARSPTAPGRSSPDQCRFSPPASGDEPMQLLCSPRRISSAI